MIENIPDSVSKIQASLDIIDFEMKKIEEEIKVCIFKIKHSENFDDCTEAFESIEKILLAYGKFIFNSNLKVSESLYVYFTDFDRIDDFNERKRLFSLVKEI
jgi:hypothetical protein